MLTNISVHDFLTGMAGGSLSVLLVAFAGRYVTSKFAPTLDTKIVGFCLAAGMMLGGGTIIRGSPDPSEVEIAGRGIASFLVLATLWFAWFKRHAKRNIESQ
ncbi:hypothetical protein FHT02_003646 [Sphingomonas xinjiangensis]|uniref:Uncharacterized protein n=1 Tax=Sphingomonas xinjiangensis TaxID=643568 RepID=A0A840YRT6_9SPHN|nr:hypothetical protein [Sphingomonas xinjiangensis]